jgi:hypothetical protein
MTAIDDMDRHLRPGTKLTIASVEQIKSQLIEDGDLRQGEHDRPHIVNIEDMLGYYQQACEFLVHQVEELRSCLYDWQKAVDECDGRAWMRRRARVLGLREPKFEEE